MTDKLQEEAAKEFPLIPDADDFTYPGSALNHYQRAAWIKGAQGRKDAIDRLIKKYEGFIGNLEWHIKVNDPEDSRKLRPRINDFMSVVADLQSIYHQPEGANKEG